MDGSDPFMTGGHQILKMRRPHWPKRVPPWTKNDVEVQRVLLQSFPKLMSDDKQRAAAARWVRVIYLYFRAQKTYSEVAEEMNEKIETMHTLIRSIRRAGKGLRSNGSGLRTRRAPIQTSFRKAGETL